MPNACVFCGGDDAALTREHFPPGWVEEVLPTEPTHEHYRLQGDDSPPSVWRTKPYGIAAKVVCQRCNNNWMSRLESRAKELLPTYLLGERRFMRPTAQQVIATWSFKSAMIVNQIANPRGRVVPGAHYRQLYVGKQPPIGGVTILTARRRIPDNYDPWAMLRTNVQDVGKDLTSPPHVVHAVSAGCCFYRVTVALAGFIFQVSGHDLPFSINLNLPYGYEQVWPVRPGFIWGEIVLEDDQIDGLPYP